MILGLLALVVYVGYTIYLPKAMTQALVENQDLERLPDQIKEEVALVKEEVEKQMDKLPELMKESDIEYEDLVAAIDEVDVDQIGSVIEELKLNNWETPDDVFDIATNHIELEGFDLEKLRPLFNEYVSQERIHELIERAEKNEFLTLLGIPMAKEFAKGILESKKDEILLQLESEQ